MSHPVDNSKRRFLTTAASVIVGGSGMAVAAVPFVKSMLPSAKAKAAGAPVEVNIGKLDVGQLITIEWRGKPVWIFRRSPQSVKILASLDNDLRDPNSDNTDQQPEYAKNPARAIREDIMVLVGICTHLGCSPTYRPDLAPADLGANWQGGFFCPCHGSRFDLAGRVFKGVPAPINLKVPPYHFQDKNLVVVGEEAQKTT